MNSKPFKAKLRRIGNSIGIYIPQNVITSYNIGDVITFIIGENVITQPNVITEKPKNVITKDKNVITSGGNVITPNRIRNGGK